MSAHFGSMQKSHLILFSVLLGFFVISTIVLSILTGVFVTKYNNANTPPSYPPGYFFQINTTWNNQSISHAPINITITWNPSSTAVNIDFEAPLYLDPPTLPNTTAGVVVGLFKSEVVEIFFANSNNQYVEIELGPMNQWWCLLLYAESKDLNTGEFLQISVWNELNKSVLPVSPGSWRGHAEIPFAYFPANFSSMNAYNIHGENGDLVYEALNPTPYGEFKGPNFHRLQYFKEINPLQLVPSEFYNHQHPYNDPRYGNLWQQYA